MTPDADIYVEVVSDGNSDWSAWRFWPAGSPAPYGVDANLIYGFRPEPDAATLQALLVEGQRHAQQERIRLGLPAQLAGAGQPGGAPAGAAAAHGAVANLAGVPAAQLAGNQGGCGHAQLAAALQANGGGDPGDDARTLPVSRDGDGNRYKEFRQAVLQSKPMEFADWPVGGPRTTKHVLLQMLDHGSSAIGHHQSWRVACRFQPTDGPAMEHEAWCKVLHTLVTYDQVDTTNLAGVELIARAIQKIEEKHKHKLSAVDDAGETALFMGATNGSRQGLVISPKLTEWIGTEMQKEAMIAKERRKAREERALSRKGEKDNKKPEWGAVHAEAQLCWSPCYCFPFCFACLAESWAE